MQTNAENFGLQFSPLNIGYSSRVEKVNTLINSVYTLQAKIQEENLTETNATNNPALQAEGAWDQFRGNGVGTNPAGINVSVQEAAEAFFNAVDAI
jgi:hypothetical protein